MSITDIHKFRGSHVSYAIKCDEGKIYVGSTSDTETRLFLHGQGKAAQFTREYPPTGEFLHIREHATQREALLCERGPLAAFCRTIRRGRGQRGSLDFRWRLW